ncbi:alpha/beta hydrolase [Nocardia puris]|uniref:Alpha/beta hydrolase family protein n=1 Tax=Nocardia puris TaxID=208602 RepID=A0A366DJM4_9NOCA|nr:alpha/beta fold hydrolase [Nocardia puris]MBF6213346.1 alpha/beta hydrolase [Nocardia puris]MBF6369486.1 alpha/beta hydrolase [Nocardia puris]MBF6462225.1 alpha/beta hydrolase [Nocardia puris]RBO89534.1 alpha/beta hydrolase family protein [Nocardia puris]
MARIVLVPGFWLGAWAWDEVAADLRGRGHDVVALTPPGRDPADPDRFTATFEQQARAILDAAGDAEDVVVVAHSGGASAAYLATDYAPDRFRRAVYVDAAPVRDGFVIKGDLGDATEYPLPDWELFESEGTSLDGLDEAALARFRERAVSEPASIAGAPLRLSDSPARLRVPTTVVCTSITAELVRQLSASGEAPAFEEIDRLADVTLLDLPTGHWPMWSEAKKLADLIDAATVE